MLENKRRSILSEKLEHLSKLKKKALGAKVQVLERAKEVRQQSLETESERQHLQRMNFELNKVQAKIIVEQREGVAKARQDLSEKRKEEVK